MPILNIVYNTTHLVQFGSAHTIHNHLSSYKEDMDCDKSNKKNTITAIFLQEKGNILNFFRGSNSVCMLCLGTTKGRSGAGVKM